LIDGEGGGRVAELLREEPGQFGSVLLGVRAVHVTDGGGDGRLERRVARGRAEAEVEYGGRSPGRVDVDVGRHEVTVDRRDRGVGQRPQRVQRASDPGVEVGHPRGEDSAVPGHGPGDQSGERVLEAVVALPEGPVVALDGQPAHRVRARHRRQTTQDGKQRVLVPDGQFALVLLVRGVAPHRDTGQLTLVRHHDALVLLDVEDLGGGEGQAVCCDVRVDLADELARRPAGPHLGDPAGAQRVDDPLDAGADTAGLRVSAVGEVFGPGVGTRFVAPGGLHARIRSAGAPA
jgi:hypothetical protein